MSNELIPQSNNINDIVRIGKVFFESGMFTDVKSMAAAIVKVQAGAELGIPPFQAMSGVHIISGKPCIGAGLMAAKIDQHPAYDFEVLQQNDKVCEIKFFKNGKEKGISKFTAEDAKKAGTKNMDKFPPNMLYARAMSNGVKWYCPGVFAGPVYTPEEFGVNENEVGTSAQVISQDKPVEVEIKPIEAEVLPEQEEAPEPPKMATNKQKEELQKLLNNSVITSAEKARGLTAIQTYNEITATEAIRKLKKVIADREAEQDGAPEVAAEPAGFQK